MCTAGKCGCGRCGTTGRGDVSVALQKALERAAREAERQKKPV